MAGIRIAGLEEVTTLNDNMVLATDGQEGTKKISVGQLLSNVTLTGEASGAIASFSDALDASMKSCTVSIEPVQDLHGYDRPWAGGAGKNLVPMTVDGIKAANTTGTWSGNTYTIDTATVTILTDTANNITGIKLGGSLSVGRNFQLGSLSKSSFTWTMSTGVSNQTSVVLAVATSSGNKNAYDTETFDSDIVGNIFLSWGTTGAVDLTLYPQIEAGSTETAFEPYSNICPITGHDEVTVDVVGKNLFDKDSTITGKVVKDDGELMSVSWGSVSDFIPIKSNTDYYITNGVGSATFFSAAVYDKDKRFLRVLNLPGSSLQSGVISSGNNAAYLRLNTYISQIGTAMLTEGSTEPSSYIPYNGHTYTINLGTTVYYATIDLVTGVMTVWGASLTDFSDLTFEPNRSGENAYEVYFDAQGKANGESDLISNVLQVKTTYTDVAEYSCRGFANSVEIAIKFPKTVVSTPEQAKQWCINNGLQFAYELATPYTVQLTPTQVRSLLGFNNVWSDSGEMTSVVYVRDINAVIGDILRRLEALEPTRSAKSIEAPAEEEKLEEAPAEK